MRTPLCAGVMCHKRMRTGSAKASDRASKASKNVALPMMMRAFACHRENGTLSMREIRAAASMSLDWIMLRTLSGKWEQEPQEAQGTRKFNQCREASEWKLPSFAFLCQG